MERTKNWTPRLLKLYEHYHRTQWTTKEATTYLEIYWNTMVYFLMVQNTGQTYTYALQTTIWCFHWLQTWATSCWCLQDKPRAKPTWRAYTSTVWLFALPWRCSTGPDGFDQDAWIIQCCKVDNKLHRQNRKIRMFYFLYLLIKLMACGSVKLSVYRQLT